MSTACSTSQAAARSDWRDYRKEPSRSWRSSRTNPSAENSTLILLLQHRDAQHFLCRKESVLFLHPRPLAL